MIGDGNNRAYQFEIDDYCHIMFVKSGGLVERLTKVNLIEKCEHFIQCSIYGSYAVYLKSIHTWQKDDV